MATALATVVMTMFAMPISLFDNYWWATAFLWITLFIGTSNTVAIVGIILGQVEPELRPKANAVSMFT